MKEPKKISSEIEKINMKPLSIGLRRLRREHLTKKKFKRKFRLSHSCISRICRQLLNMELKLRREKQRKPLSCIEKNQCSVPNLNCSTWKRPVIILSNNHKEKNCIESPRKKMKYEKELNDEGETQIGNSVNCKTSPEKRNYSSGIDVKRFSILTKDGLQTINTKSVSLPRKKLNSLSSPVKLDMIIKKESQSPKPSETEDVSVTNENIAPNSSAPFIRINNAIKKAFLNSEEVVDMKEQIPTSTSIESLPGNKDDFQNSEEISTRKTVSVLEDRSGGLEGFSKEPGVTRQGHSDDELGSDEREGSLPAGKASTSGSNSGIDTDDESTRTSESDEDDTDYPFIHHSSTMDSPFDPTKFLSCDITTDAQEEEELDRIQFKSQNFQLNCEVKVILKALRARDVTNTFCFHNNISGMCGFRLRLQLSKMKFTAVMGKPYKPVLFSEPMEPPKVIEPPEYTPGPPEDPFTHSLFAPIIKADEKKQKKKKKVVHAIYRVTKKPYGPSSKTFNVVDHRRPHLTHFSNLPPGSANYPRPHSFGEGTYSKYIRISVPPGKPMTLSNAYSPIYESNQSAHPANSSFPPQTGVIPPNRLAFPPRAGIIAPNNSPFRHQVGIITPNNSSFPCQGGVISPNSQRFPIQTGVIPPNNSPFPPQGGSFTDRKISRPLFVTPANNIIRPITNHGVPSSLPQNVNISYIVLPSNANSLRFSPPNATIPQVQDPCQANPSCSSSQGMPVSSHGQPILLSSGGPTFGGPSTTTYCRPIISSENFCKSNSHKFSISTQSSYVNNPSYKQPTNSPSFYSNIPNSGLRVNPSISEKIVVSTVSSTTPTFQPTLTPSFPTTSHQINSIIHQSPVPINEKPYFLATPNSPHLSSSSQVNFISQSNNISSLPINAPSNPCNIDQPPILPNATLMPGSNDQPPILPNATLMPGSNDQAPILPNATLMPGSNDQPPILPNATLMPGSNDQPPILPNATLMPASNDQPPILPNATLMPPINDQPPILPNATLMPPINDQPHILPNATLMPATNGPPILPNATLMPATNDQLSSLYTGVSSEQTPVVANPSQSFPSTNSESRNASFIGQPPPPLKLGNVPVENSGGMNSQPPLLKKMALPVAPEDDRNSALSNFDDAICNFEESSTFDEYKEDALRKVTKYIMIFLVYGFSKEPSSVFNAAYQMLLASMCCKPHALEVAKQINFSALSIRRGTYVPCILDMPTLPLTQTYEELEISYDLFILKRFLFAVDKVTREVLYPLPPLCNLKDNNAVDKVSVVVMISPRFGLGPGIIIFPHAILDRKLRLSFGNTGPLALNWVMSAHQRGGLTQSMMLEFLNGEGLNWLRSLGLSGSNIRLGVDWWWCIDKLDMDSFYSQAIFQSLHVKFPNHRDPLDISVSITLERVWGMLVRKWCSSHGSKLLEENFPRFIFKTLDALCEMKRLRAWCRVGGLYPLDNNRVKEFLDAITNDL